MWLELLKLENRLENGTKLRTVVTLFNVIVFFLLLLLFALYTMIEKSATRINARNKNEKKREEKKK